MHPALTVKHINIQLLIVELRRCHIQCKHHILSRLIPCHLTGIHQHPQSLFRIRKIRCKATFITYCGIITALPKQRFQTLVDLRTHPYTFPEIWRTHRQDHKFLNVNRVVRMSATVHNIHHRNRQCPRLYTAKIRVQWTFGYFCCRSRRCHRHPENRISAKFPLIPAAIKSHQHLVQPSLIQHIHPHDLRRDPCIHMVSRVLHTFPHVTCLSVTQFDCFIFPGGRTRRYTCTPHGFLSGQYLHLDRRIPPRIKDFSRIYISDRYIFIHKKIPPITGGIISRFRLFYPTTRPSARITSIT